MITHDFSPFPAALAVQYNIDDIGKMFAGTFLIKKVLKFIHLGQLYRLC